MNVNRVLVVVGAGAQKAAVNTAPSVSISGVAERLSGGTTTPPTKRRHTIRFMIIVKATKDSDHRR
jgi:hypothetical protein